MSPDRSLLRRGAYLRAEFICRLEISVVCFWFYLDVNNGLYRRAVAKILVDASRHYERCEIIDAVCVPELVET